MSGAGERTCIFVLVAHQVSSRRVMEVMALDLRVGEYMIDRTLLDSRAVPFARRHQTLPSLTCPRIAWWTAKTNPQSLLG